MNKEQHSSIIKSIETLERELSFLRGMVDGAREVAAKTEAVEKRIIRPVDIIVSTYSSPRGGFGYNHDVGVQVQHHPTGISVKSHSERSQHTNKAKALESLMAILLKDGWVGE